ncbi:DddA-like double-stranded DNA deaminase toxin [Lentzea sp. BCCO 10_0798]|uniref:DddA-like double-stranded DNA deaminase toxin n=1 Tax=Lentzea kristufekii TaxID=3095430 RepID=A0ABU4TSI5_9PSEU|nr:DddA-like double-stranded DNA deaminase toxin [Lentzea sp. BCCO 10_0798]MDX8051245.1 DddA-like double-stranded DNA deaminase toxin [Lentzea sp. BCCO 10_0798]
MASFEEVAAALDQVLGTADRAREALAQAGRLVEEAADLLEDVAYGAGHLEDDFNQTVQAWRDVAAGAAELAQVITAGCRVTEQYRKPLQGDLSVRSPEEPVLRTHLPKSTSQAVSTPVPSLDGAWIEEQRSQLPTYVTSGIYRDEDGNADLVQSGQEPDGEHLAIGAHLQPLGFPMGGKGRVAATEHVEVKVAWRQRNAGITHTDVVINNELCVGLYSCRNVLPYVLLPGQTMTVHGPVESETFTGRVLP